MTVWNGWIEPHRRKILNRWWVFLKCHGNVMKPPQRHLQQQMGDLWLDIAWGGLAWVNAKGTLVQACPIFQCQCGFDKLWWRTSKVGQRKWKIVYRVYYKHTNEGLDVLGEVTKTCMLFSDVQLTLECALPSDSLNTTGLLSPTWLKSRTLAHKVIKYDTKGRSALLFLSYIAFFGDTTGNLIDVGSKKMVSGMD